MVEQPLDRARYRKILRFAVRNLLVTWWYEILLPLIGLSRIADRTRPRRMQKFARRFRTLAVELGGLMIKLGQFMSSRLDVLPPEITKELEDLQDEVPPVPFAAIRALAEDELGLPLEKVFTRIDEEPLASASLGQAHRAQLLTEDSDAAGFVDVVMKVQRPGIGSVVAVDLAALRKIGGWLSRVRLVNRRVDMPALVEEFGQVSLEEIDYLHEGLNAEKFEENFVADDRVRVPAVVWERSTRRVLTLEDVTAIKITDHAALRAAGIDPADVASVFAEVMFDQLFKHSFFHADPHPGNLFIAPGSEHKDGPPWRLTFVDFGMMGHVPANLRGALRALIIAAAARDGRGLVVAMREADVLLPNADTAELERVMTQVFDRFGGMSTAELRDLDPRQFRDFAMEFSDVLLTLPFQLPENYLLIGRAMSLTSGVSSALHPGYNMWDSVEPYAQTLLRAEGGNLVGDLVREGLDNVALLWRLPARVDSVVTRIEDGTLPLSAPKLEDAVTRLERTARRGVSALVFAGLLVGGALVRPEEPGLSTALMVASALPLVHVLIGGPGRGR